MNLLITLSLKHITVQNSAKVILSFVVVITLKKNNNVGIFSKFFTYILKNAY